jgi:hypothetical protein
MLLREMNPSVVLVLVCQPFICIMVLDEMKKKGIEQATNVGDAVLQCGLIIR